MHVVVRTRHGALAYENIDTWKKIVPVCVKFFMLQPRFLTEWIIRLWLSAKTRCLKCIFECMRNSVFPFLFVFYKKKDPRSERKVVKIF